MKKINTIIILINFCTLGIFGQELTQTVRGKIIDADSKLPLIGASVIIAETDPVIGTITDMEGNFRMENIPVGRLTLQISYMGYESKTIPNIEVNSGKEAVLDFSLQEAVMQMQEVVVKPKKMVRLLTKWR